MCLWVSCGVDVVAAAVAVVVGRLDPREDEVEEEVDKEQEASVDEVFLSDGCLPNADDDWVVVVVVVIDEGVGWVGWTRASI